MYIYRTVYVQLTLLACTVRFTSGCIKKRRSKVEKVFSNSLLSGTYPLAVEQTTSVLQCTNKCIANVKCRSVNHDRIGGICQLLDTETKNNKGAVENKYGWDHYAVMTQELSSVLCKSLPGYINTFAPSVYISLSSENGTHGFYDVGSDENGNTNFILSGEDVIEEKDGMNVLKKESQQKLDIGYFKPTALSNPGLQNFTLMFWFKSSPRVVSVEKDCYLMKIGGVVARGMSILLQTDGNILVRIRHTRDENSIEKIIPPATFQHWTHLAVNWNDFRETNNKVELFVNGKVGGIRSHFPHNVIVPIPNTNDALHTTCTKMYYSNLAIWWDAVPEEDIIDMFVQSKCCA